MEKIINAIVKEMGEVLNERNYEYSTYSLFDIVNEWFKQKKDLIELFSKHPNWSQEKLMIQFDSDIERNIDTYQVSIFSNWLEEAANIPYRNYWHEEHPRERKILNFIREIKEQFFNETMQKNIDEINKLNENFKLRNNMKSSKAIGKICREEGWDKLDGFNKKYADLCDALSPLKIKRHTCISLNPIDYLLMSNGNSWNSCHDIGYMDGGYDDEPGCHSSGTISYMLDKHSFVFYTVDANYNGNEIELEPKIQRQMFGYNDEVLAQLRLYPQSNDYGANQIYTDIREIVQKVIADCLGKPNLWIRSKEDVEDVCSKGSGATCYPDWRKCNPGGQHCSISTHKERENGKENRKIIFGAEPICIDCGRRHSYNENISCCDDYEICEICGARIHRDDVIWGGCYGDVAYCEDCCTWCEECERYFPNDEVQEIDGRYVCDDCISDGDYYTCYECGELHHIDDMVTGYDKYGNEVEYCQDCAYDYTFICDDCGERHHTDNEHYDEETGNYYCKDCYAELLLNRKEEIDEKLRELGIA